MRTPHRILLASSSRYRKALLKKLIDNFDICAPNLDESPLLNESVGNLSSRLAREKAVALVSSHPRHWIIGSDQVAIRESTRLDKPGDYVTAFRQLHESSGKCVTFLTSVCLVAPGAEKIKTETDTCRVYFRILSKELIDRYLKREQPYDCAAAFKSEGSGIALVEKIQGDDPNALIGLPLILLTRMMEDFGLDFL